MSYEYMPAPKNQWVKTLCIGLFFGALVLFLTSGFEGVIAMPWILQTLSVIMMVTSILLMGKYLMKYYLYRIEEVDDGVDFTVTEITRRGGVTVCRLALSQLTSVTEWSKENRPPRGKRIYNYCADARPVTSCLLTFADGNDVIYVRFSPDEKMMEILQNAARGGEGTAQ